MGLPTRGHPASKVSITVVLMRDANFHSDPRPSDHTALGAGLLRRLPEDSDVCQRWRTTVVRLSKSFLHGVSPRRVDHLDQEHHLSHSDTWRRGAERLTTCLF